MNIDPPFERAIKELKKLESFVLKKDQDYKQYYSSLTGIVRRYLEEDAKVSALESTSDQLLIKLELLKTEGILDFGTLERHVSTNPYNIKNHYKGIAQKFLLELLDAMQGTIYYDRSDIQTDYFDVAYYISIHIGKWDKPYILHTYVNKIQDELNGVINNE